MGFVCVTPRRTPVNEGLKLPRDICSIGRRYRYYDISIVVLIHNVPDDVGIAHNTFCSAVACPTPVAKIKRIIINTYTLYGIFSRQLFSNRFNYFCCCTCANRTAVNNQCIHISTYNPIILDGDWIYSFLPVITGYLNPSLIYFEKALWICTYISTALTGMR